MFGAWDGTWSQFPVSWTLLPSATDELGVKSGKKVVQTSVSWFTGKNTREWGQAQSSALFFRPFSTEQKPYTARDVTAKPVASRVSLWGRVEEKTLFQHLGQKKVLGETAAELWQPLSNCGVACEEKLTPVSAHSTPTHAPQPRPACSQHQPGS